MNNFPLRFSAFVLLILAHISFSLSSQTIAPVFKMKTSGAITDFFIEGTDVILTTDAGTIEIYNFVKGTRKEITHLPEMKDFMGDPVPSKVYSIDKHSDKFLLVTQGNHGFRNVLISDGKSQKKLIDADVDKKLVKKARFINENQILLGLMSNELILFDIEKQEIIYNLSISAYTFSDFDLSDDKRFAFTSDESGVVHKINIQEGIVVNEYSGNNVDNVYKLVCKNGTIITAGQDRRVGVYQTMTDSKYYLQNDFLVYAVGLNDDGIIGAYTADEENNIFLFDITSKMEINKLSGHQSVVTKMEFIGDKKLISASDDHYLMIWNLEY